MNAAFPELVQGEMLLTADAKRLILRHVHPQFVNAGIISSQAFLPNSHDGGCLSVVQKGEVEPADAHFEYTVIHSLESAGLWALSTKNVDDVGSRTVDDRRSIAVTNPGDLPAGHAYLDYRDLNGISNQEKKRARQLKKVAQVRGCIYSPLREDDPAASPI